MTRVQPAGLPAHPASFQTNPEREVRRRSLYFVINFQGLFDYYTPDIPVFVSKFGLPVPVGEKAGRRR